MRQHLPEVMLQTCGSKGALKTGEKNSDLRICGSRITQTCRGSDEWDHRGNIQSKGVLLGPQNTVQSESLFVFMLIPFSVQSWLFTSMLIIPETAKTKSESSHLRYWIWNELLF